MLIRLSELRTLISEVLTEADKKGGKKGKWVPPWLNKDKKAKNEAASSADKKEEEPAAKSPPEKKAAVSVKKEKSGSSSKAMPVGHELNKGKGKASDAGSGSSKKKAAPADKKVSAKSEKAPVKKGSGDIAPKFRGKPSPRAEFGGDEFTSDDEHLGPPEDDDISAGVDELETPQSFEDVPTNVVGLRVWLRDFVAPRIPESQIAAFHRLVTAFVSQAEERTLAQKEPEMRKRLGINGGAAGGKQAARPTKMGQPSPKVGGAGKSAVAGPAGLSEKKK